VWGCWLDELGFIANGQRHLYLPPRVDEPDIEGLLKIIITDT
jgi:hypothetical protein